MWSDNSIKWVVNLAVLHWPEPWKIYNTHDSVITAWYSIAVSLKHYAHGHCISVLHRGTPTSNIGHIFQEFDMVFLLEKTPTSYIQWQSLSCHMLAYASSACLYGIATPLSCTMYVLCNNTYCRVGCTFKRKGPFNLRRWRLESWPVVYRATINALKSETFDNQLWIMNFRTLFSIFCFLYYFSINDSMLPSVCYTVIYMVRM